MSTTKPQALKKPTLAATANKALSFAEGAAKAPASKTASSAGKRVFYAPEGHRRLTINLPEATHKKLRLMAVEQDSTVTEIILRLLAKELGD